MEVLLQYFLIINFALFIIAGYDKYSAIKNKRRIPENTLFFMALLGGSIGLFLAMLIFRHKTSKNSFIVKFCGIFLIQIMLVYLKLSDKI
ncbi:DUF1294 domain-containing protein [Flavobacterium cheongpyeongense]|jgi:uncharacterized membrane protein YsdA (DUF1294 family)|uniref:DUF1294 domain-containing protein n=1 Tax=Flavobacterium cheongpyeongense TaxID=2212651 RepID=A0A2V4BZ51_9FLAO|nr:DUF1294 domain-containing protein [Flavobacterium cheongpyeongense]PXY39274.1 DUF1294 domain-containing protein [Flavobacterium cheongpyeongense]